MLLLSALALLVPVLAQTDAVVKAGGPVNDIDVNVSGVAQCQEATVSWSGTAEVSWSWVWSRG